MKKKGKERYQEGRERQDSAKKQGKKGDRANILMYTGADEREGWL